MVPVTSLQQAYVLGLLCIFTLLFLHTSDFLSMVNTVCMENLWEFFGPVGVSEQGNERAL